MNATLWCCRALAPDPPHPLRILPPTMKPLLRLWPLARGLRGLMLLTLTISLLTQSLTVVVPLLAGRMVREAVELHRVSELPRLSLLILGLFIVRGALNWTEIYFGSKVGQAVS